jgi:cystathionine beta-lyase
MKDNHFDQPIDRQHSASIKWSLREEIFGSREVLPMWVADMDFSTAPAILSALEQRVKHGIFGYVAIPPSFFKAIVGWLTRRFAWPVEEEWLLFCPGVVPALGMLLRCFSKPGDKILIQQPVYHLFSQIITNNERQVVNNPLRLEEGRYTIDFADLEKNLAAGVKLFIFCSPHNPVGRVWTEEELKRVGELCLKYNTLLISDEVHSDLICSGYRHTPVATLSQAILNNTITCMAPSKSFNLAGLQTAYLIIANPILRKQYEKEQERLDLTLPNTFGVIALEKAYTEGEAWLNGLLAYLEDNLSFVTEFFAKHLSPLKIIPPQATYLVWLDCRGLKMKEAELKNFFYQAAKVGLDLGSKFGAEGEGFARLNIACPRKTLKEALERIQAALQKQALPC